MKPKHNMATTSQPHHTLQLIENTQQLLADDLTQASGEAVPTLSAWRGILEAEGMIEIHQKLGMLKNALEAGHGDHIKATLKDLSRMTEAAASEAEPELQENLQDLAVQLRNAAEALQTGDSSMIRNVDGPETPTEAYNMGEDGDRNTAPQGTRAMAPGNVGSEPQQPQTPYPSQAEGEDDGAGKERQESAEAENNPGPYGHPSQAEGEDVSNLGRGGYELEATETEKEVSQTGTDTNHKPTY